MKFEKYITEKAKKTKKKGYERDRKEFVQAIDKAIDKNDRKMLQKIGKDLEMSYLKSAEKQDLMRYVYRLAQGM